MATPRTSGSHVSQACVATLCGTGAVDLAKHGIAQWNQGLGKSWLGDQDSNLGCPVQSRVFYR